MKKRFVIIRLLLFLGLFLLSVFAYDSYIDDNKYSHNPVNMSSYEVSEYYSIDPNSILNALSQGETSVFAPFQGDPFITEELLNINISWTQADYLKIADALSRFVWGEPSGFKDWKVYSLHFRISCQSTGFDYSEITYYKPHEVMSYITRHIEMDPYSGIVRVGYGETYPQPILFNKWNDYNLPASKITADNALQIADENGGGQVRLKDNNECYITMRAPASVTNNNDQWRLTYVGSNTFEIYVDPYNGEFEVQQ